MFFEDVKVRRGETVSGLAAAYGYKASEWRKIWDHPRNLDVVARSGVPERLQIGATLYVPISWMVVKKSLTARPDGAAIVVQRDGELGKRLTWVQTVYQHNQPVAELRPIEAISATPRDLTPMYPGATFTPAAFFDPLADDEIAAWEGPGGDLSRAAEDRAAYPSRPRPRRARRTRR